MNEFAPILKLIREARGKALQSANYYLLHLYWQLGGHISQKLADGSWGEKIVDRLAAWLKENEMGLKGFDRRNLYRMRSFYETWRQFDFPAALQNSKSTYLADYQNIEFVVTASPQLTTGLFPFVTTLSPQIVAMPPLLSRISWSHHIDLLSKTVQLEEKFFYLLLCIKENYTVRDLRRQIDSGLFERHLLSKHQLPLLNHPEAGKILQIFKDTYIAEFLDLPEPHSERELQKALVAQMKKFILDLGGDFIFIGEEYKLQAGMKDYFLDLLFYHRELRCLVVIELKIEDFKPEHLGKLNFYLEALDRDLKKPQENPSIGLLLCKTKDSEVVEYAMSRNMSPAMIAEYQTKLPNKKILQQKMHELLQNNLSIDAAEIPGKT